MGTVGWQQLTAEQIGIERILLAVSPSGSVAPDCSRCSGRSCSTSWSTALKVIRKLDAADAVPAHPRNTGNDRVYWDFEAAFVDEDSVVAGTSECDARYGPVRHWLVDVNGMDLLGELSYPLPVSGPARTAGGGRWYTISKDGTSVHLWELGQEK